MRVLEVSESTVLSLSIAGVSIWIINKMSMVFTFLYYPLQCKVSFKVK